jgi:hypothetical protein
MSSLYKLANRITGEVTGVDLDLCMWKMQEALTSIYDEVDWAFQRTITYANWLCPGQVANSGTFTVTPYSNTVTADTAASQQINTYTAQAGSALLTTLQYRDPAYSIYNIVGVGGDGTTSYVTVLTAGSSQTPGTYTLNVLDAAATGVGGTVQVVVNPDGTVTLPPVVLTAGSGYQVPYITLAEGGTPATFQVFQNLVLTLDRPWLEPTSGPGQPYMIYQVYFVAPVLNFHKFIEMRDTTNSAPLNFWDINQAELAIRDPQRTEFTNSSYCVPAGFDYRPGTATPGYPMFELWPQQLDYLPYSFSYRQKGLPGYPAGVPESFQDFQTYVLPPPITQNLLGWKTKEVLYQYKEAQRDKQAARGSGANWLLLAQYAAKEYARVLDKLIAIDLNLNGEAFQRLPGRGRPLSGQPYSNQLGQFNVGGYPESDE